MIDLAAAQPPLRSQAADNPQPQRVGQGGKDMLWCECVSWGVLLGCHFLCIVSYLLVIAKASTTTPAATNGIA